MTVEIILTKGYVAIVDDEDADLAKLYWYAYAPKTSNTVYARGKHTVAKKKRITEQLHRLILERILGRKLLSSEKVDHKDGDGLNNRRKNLRLATFSQNAQNRGKNTSRHSTSKFKGVSWNARLGKWKSSIRANGSEKYLGLFQREEDAYAAYCKAAEELHGEFARTK